MNTFISNRNKKNSANTSGLNNDSILEEEHGQGIALTSVNGNAMGMGGMNGVRSVVEGGHGNGGEMESWEVDGKRGIVVENRFDVTSSV